MRIGKVWWMGRTRSSAERKCWYLRAERAVWPKGTGHTMCAVRNAPSSLLPTLTAKEKVQQYKPFARQTTVLFLRMDLVPHANAAHYLVFCFPLRFVQAQSSGKQKNNLKTLSGCVWWRQQDSNLWPHGCEPCALTNWAMPPYVVRVCRTNLVVYALYILLRAASAFFLRFTLGFS